ncbi:MAG TPA: cation:proton antiporter [Myxococcota bacterium]|jgi:NhaP-type Na+/H+ or K+/H+ antiporter/rhodanese-related sulfurtransferase|nr:cation:proton antiporter [Myxococcota bacterium]
MASLQKIRDRDYRHRVEPVTSPLVLALALVGAVIVIASLLSGLIERSGIPQVGIFLALGAALGPFGLGALAVPLESPLLHAVATLSLALILFTDALGIDRRELRTHGRLAFILLGPGTLFSAVLFAGLAYALLDVSPAAAAILGAALASTDPVLLRGLLRRPDLGPARPGLRLESGLNDVVLLPIVLVAMILLPSSPTPFSGTVAARLGLDLFLLGPGAGVAVGLIGIATLDLVRRRLGVRRDYESLYSLGICFAAYAAAESLHGSGFLAAFAAGLTIAAFDVELCDCFREYGETTAELALLLTFVLLGSSLIWTGVESADWRSLAFAGLVLIGRPIVYSLALARTHLDRRSRWLMAWFGPRGLSTLLLVLLPVFAGAAEAEALFRVACLVVLLSVLVHGGGLMLMGSVEAPTPIPLPIAPLQALAATGAAPPAPGSKSHPAPASTSPAAYLEFGDASDEIRIDEVKALLGVGAPVLVGDVRREGEWASAETLAGGAVRITPDMAADDARRLGIPQDAWVVLYCSCPNEETSSRVARDLKRRGYTRARALVGGWKAWQEAGLPVAPMPSRAGA